MRPPRRSPLFPYTTLSRSVGVAPVDQDVARREMWHQLLDRLVHRLPGLHHQQDRARSLDRGDEGGDVVRGREFAFAAVDRKSTRLNSSHLVISYAVFCLKK